MVRAHRDALCQTPRSETVCARSKILRFIRNRLLSSRLPGDYLSTCNEKYACGRQHFQCKRATVSKRCDWLSKVKIKTNWRKTMKEKIMKFLRDESGLTTVEYAVAGALVAAAVVTAFGALGNQVGIVINGLKDAID